MPVEGLGVLSLGSVGGTRGGGSGRGEEAQSDLGRNWLWGGECEDPEVCWAELPKGTSLEPREGPKQGGHALTVLPPMLEGTPEMTPLWEQPIPGAPLMGRTSRPRA